MHVLSVAPGGSAWTFGGSILTFAFPMILFIAVGGTLWILYTKPELVPGRWVGDAERPVSYTPVPHQPAAAAGQAVTAGDEAATPEDTAAASTGDGADQPVTAGEAAAAPDGGEPAAAEDSEAAATESTAAAATESTEASATEGTEAATTGDGE